MITYLFKECIFYLALISDGFCPGIFYIVTHFPCFDHFFYQVAGLIDMFGYFFQYLFLIDDMLIQANLLLLIHGYFWQVNFGSE